MFKLNWLIFVMAIIAVAKGQQQLANNNIYNSTLRTDDYINLNRHQYVKTIANYDMQMEMFKQNYDASLDSINIQRDMLIDSLVENEDKLNPLEVLSDLSKQCITQYRSSIPTIIETKTKINECVTTASNKVNNLLSNALNTRNSMESYITKTFDRKISNCKSSYINYPLNYTICATNVVTEANAYTITSQKTFATQMDDAQCSAKANIKKALDCSYTIQNNTISAIAEANTLINKCLLGQNDCKQCNQNYTCSEVAYMYKSEINYNSKTMNNPFYGRNKATECLLLKLI